MENSPNSEVAQKLESAQNIWVGSVRPDGRPHLTPIWYVYLSGRIYLSTDPESVKSRNIANNPRVVLALEDGTHPVICEGRAAAVAKPYSEEILDAFRQKYEWEIATDTQYNHLIEVIPEKWLSW